MTLRRAVFLDRDGTLVYPRHYPTRPDDLVLYPDIGAGLRLLQDAGFALIVITNQSGLARGLFDVTALDRMHVHLTRELEREGVQLDAIYYCPHHREGTVPELAVACTCRKPEPGMLLQAAADLRLDLAASWFVGDILDDVQAGNCAGCRTILVDVGTEQSPATSSRQPSYVARSTAHALDIIAGVEGLSPLPDLAYVPQSWSATHV